MKKHNSKIFRLSNNFSTPKKIYNQDTEDVYKLNFFNINNNTKSEEKQKITQLISKIKPTQSIGTSELLKSIEKVKKFLPNIVNLINITENKKTEVKLFKRLEHQEYEKTFKKELKKVNERRQNIKNILCEKREELQKLDNQIYDMKLSFNVISKFKKNPLIFKNDLKKKMPLRYNIKQLSSPQLNTLINNNADKNKKNSNTYLTKNNIENKRKNYINKNNEIFKYNNNNNDEDAKNKNFSFEKLKHKQDEIAKYLHIFSQIKREKSKITAEIHKLENEKEELKDKKEKLIEHLYLYYLDLLKEGNDTRNEGLSWIVREIFNLGKNVLISYFPIYLNDSAIIYIFKQAKLKILLEEYKTQIKKLRNDLIELNLLKKSKKRNIKINDINNEDYEHKDKNNESYYRLKKELSDYSIKTKTINSFQNFNSSKKNNNEFSKLNSTTRTAFSNINSDNNFNSPNISFNKFNENKKDNICIYPNNTSINFKLSRNKNKDINNNSELTRNKLFQIVDFSNITSIPNKLTLTEVTEFLNARKSKINENNYGKIEQYFIMNEKIIIIKKLMNEIKKKEMRKIFEKYIKKGYNKQIIKEKIILLSALIGEDNVPQEINIQNREQKLYLKSINKYSLINDIQKC